MLLRPLLAILAFSTPAFADAVIYRGTIGDRPVIVELSNPIHAAVEETYGRFFYLDEGIDIPLDAVGSSPGSINLVEERPCNLDLCHDPIDSIATPQPPLGPTWHLRADVSGDDVARPSGDDAPRDNEPGTDQVSADDGAHLTGQWQTVGGDHRPIDLTRIATRPFQLDDNPAPMDLFVMPVDFDPDNAPLTDYASPYDHLRLTTATRKWGVHYLEDMAWRMVENEHIGLSMPRLVSTGGGDLTRANQWLEQRHWAMATEAYNCAAKRYMAFDWSEQDDGIAGSFAGYDSELVEVTMMTASILSWTEEGSIGCGNYAPWNHWRILNLDLETGRPFDLSLVFKSWIPGYPDEPPVPLDIARSAPDRFPWGPDQALADFIRAHRMPNPNARLEADCDYDNLIANNLAIGFRQGGEVYFALDDLPNVIQACAYELYAAPIEDLRPFLADTAGDYFWGVDHPSR